jgi:hypothetical protein
MNARTRILFVLLVPVVALGAWRLLRTPTTASAAEEQAVIATIKLRSGDMGSPEERARIVDLENQLSDAIRNSATGDFVGDEYGDAACTLYMYGPSADRLLTVTLPILKKFRAPTGSYVTKRYGKPGAKQERISLSGD